MNSIEKENKPIDERTPLVETTFYTVPCSFLYGDGRWIELRDGFSVNDALRRKFYAGGREGSYGACFW